MRSGGEIGQVWLSVCCEDGGGNHLFPHRLIPTGATVHSHCEIGLITHMKGGGGSVWIRRMNAIGLKQQVIGFRIFAKMGLEHT